MRFTLQGEVENACIKMPNIFADQNITVSGYVTIQAIQKSRPNEIKCTNKTNWNSFWRRTSRRMLRIGILN